VWSVAGGYQYMMTCIKELKRGSYYSIFTILMVCTENNGTVRK
jgi:hypothetical protein